MKRKIKAAVLCPDPHDSTSLYRGVGPWETLGRFFNNDLDVTIYTTEKIKPIDWAIMLSSDVVIMQRAFTPFHLNQIKGFKNMGKKIILDYDDDLFHVQHDNKVFRNYMNESVQKSLIEMANLSDAIIVSTKSIAETYKEKTGIECKLIKNGYIEEMFEHYWVKRPEKKPLITWRGTDSHYNDLLQVKNEINELSDENPNYTWQFVGWHPPYLMESENPKYKSLGFDIINFQKYIHECGGSIGIVPLIDNKFNRGKSNIAFMEMVSSGHVCLAQDLPEFSECGAITFKDPKDFKDKMTWIMRITDDEREVLWTKQFQSLRAFYGLHKVNYKRLDLLKSIVRI